VNAEIKQLGGTLDIESAPGQGAIFIVRLPFTLAINQALLCQVGEDAYAIPLTSIEGVMRMTHEELEHCFANPHQAFYDYAGQRYEVRSLAQLLGTGDFQLPGAGKRSPVILIQTGDYRMALQVDGLLGNREIVVKSTGAQISTVPGIYGATILADGRVVLILDVSALVRSVMTSQYVFEPEVPAVAEARVAVQTGFEPVVPAKITVMVVDDSITMRKVATRLLERNDMAVVTAKDGVDAVARLQEQVPDAMLLDIEMPRMDGYELATHMRNDERLRYVPIIMITSRTGEKHRQRAMEIGVNRYLGKPYQETDLLENLRQVLEERRVSR
jgi:chemosensory pili system protein ChpA (sensor histidine kinase/response regulator)